MNGTNIVKSMSVGAPISTKWRFAGLGDFTGDGRKDILLQHTNGVLAVVKPVGTNLVNVGSLDSGGAMDASWKVMGVMDFNRDGSGDLLTRNTDGTVAVWFLNGTNFLSVVPTILSGGDVPFNWWIAGTGDFNNDGKPDILWQTSEGYLYAWFMDGTDYLGGGYLLNGATIGSSWKVVAVADVNSDGKPDLICQSSTGYVAVRLLNGTIGISRSLLRGGVALNPVWRIVGPR